MSLSLAPVQADDFDALFALRMGAMRESLARLGLGDVERSRARFQGQFEPAFMRWIVRTNDAGASERIGFTKLQPVDDHLHIDHLFLRADAQGAGAGSWVIEQAQAQGRDITLSALKLSAANRFYLRHGFKQVGEDEYDLQYRWSAPR
ncbi:MAG: GNAT family N-acetyltransferase [Pelomonas sp.]|nr:GNAT family N-acetyltransferase [Roseateles sp.]